MIGKYDLLARIYLYLLHIQTVSLWHQEWGTKQQFVTRLPQNCTDITCIIWFWTAFFSLWSFQGKGRWRWEKTSTCVKCCHVADRQRYLNWRSKLRHIEWKILKHHYDISVDFCTTCFLVETRNEAIPHDDVIKWKHFPRYWPFVRGIFCNSDPAPNTVRLFKSYIT